MSDNQMTAAMTDETIDEVQFEPSPGPMSGWGILEIMGHREHAGLIETRELFGSGMVRIVIPSNKEKPHEERYYPVKSIFSITITDETTARKRATELAPYIPNRDRTPQQMINRITDEIDDVLYHTSEETRLQVLDSLVTKLKLDIGDMIDDDDQDEDKDQSEDYERTHEAEDDDYEEEGEDHDQEPAEEAIEMVDVEDEFIIGLPPAQHRDDPPQEVYDDEEGDIIHTDIGLVDVKRIYDRE